MNIFYLLNTYVAQCNQFRSLQLFLNHLLCPVKRSCHQVSVNTLWYYLNFLFCVDTTSVCMRFKYCQEST